MNRKLISAILALVLCLSLMGSVFAAGSTNFVVDEVGYLTEAEIRNLNTAAEAIYARTNVGVFYVYTGMENMSDYDVAALTAGLSDYYIMMENATNWRTFAKGTGESIDDDTAEQLRARYDETATYVEGVEAFLEAAAACFPDVSGATDAPVETTQSGEEYLIFDEANLLTDSEETKLAGQLMEISHDNNAQIVIATVSTLNGADVDNYLNYLYDSMGFGYGANHDGVLLLVCMDPREYRILSNGFAGVAIDPSDIDVIGEKIVSDLSDGDYASAFRKFAEQCDYYLDGYTNGFPFAFGKNLLICLVIGFVAGLIVALVLKGQLKSVRKQNRANAYVKPGSMQITVRNDMFLYREVHKTKKESSSSGSRSGGGTARSTGGGSF